MAKYLFVIIYLWVVIVFEVGEMAVANHGAVTGLML